MQLTLLQFVLDRVRGIGSPAPAMTLAQLQRTGFATGLTALTAELAADDFAAELQPYLKQQRSQVAERVDRFRPITGRVLSALAAVDV
ncbi:MAG TPA: hypothetical protein VHQ23_09880, partial [Ilumatobacteraceae bacterium]|nr:hypothetical protein [Ilumatobacteraceae bacterium]